MISALRNPKKAKNFFKKLLTTSTPCAIIKIQNEREVNAMKIFIIRFFLTDETIIEHYIKASCMEIAIQEAFDKLWRLYSDNEILLKKVEAFPKKA